MTNVTAQVHRIVLFGLSLSGFPSRFLKSARECFGDCWISQSTPYGAQRLLPLGIVAGTPPCAYPFWGSASLLTHRSVSGSDTICNGPSPPLINASIRERFSHPYKGCFVLLPNQCGIVGSHKSFPTEQSSPFQTQINGFNSSLMRFNKTSS